jgi:hypothetical protein
MLTSSPPQVANRERQTRLYLLAQASHCLIQQTPSSGKGLRTCHAIRSQVKTHHPGPSDTNARKHTRSHLTARTPGSQPCNQFMVPLCSKRTQLRKHERDAAQQARSRRWQGPKRHQHAPISPNPKAPNPNVYSCDPKSLPRRPESLQVAP